MNALPTVVRELRVGSRRWSTYWTRVGFGGIFLAVSTYIVFVSIHQRVPSTDIGTILFSSLVGIAFLYCLGSGITNTADCISQEKRDGTLGLLFLTDLKGHDIILGKLCAKGLVAFYSFLAGFPILATSFLMGGVTVTQFWHAILGLLNIYFFAHAVGLLSSTFSLQARKAHTGAAALIILFAAGVPATVATLHQFGNFKWDWINAFSLSLPLLAGTMTGYGGWWTFWRPLLYIHAMGWAFLALASWRLPHRWQDRPKNGNRSRQFGFGSPEVRVALRKRLLEVNPFFWLTSRSRFEPLFIWVVLICLAIAWCWFRFYPHRTWRMSAHDWVPIYLITIFFLNLGFRAAVAGEAARHLEEQRLNGSLEFLLSCTPLTVTDILRGQWLSLKRKLLGPAIAALVVNVVFWGIVVLARETEISRILALFAIMFIIDLTCAGWVGMWRGITSKRLRRGGGEAFGMTFFIPLLLFSLFMSVYESVLSIHLGFWQVMGGWICISGGVQIALAMTARRILRRDLRALASPLSDGTFRFWRRLGRGFGLLMHRANVG